MKYLGDFIAGQTVPVPWNTFGTGAESVTCTGGTIHVMTGTGGAETSATSLSGSSPDIRNFATRTGSHLTFVGTATLSGPADYLVKLSGATVGAATINPWLGFFSVRNRSNPTIFGRVLVAATGGTDEFQLATTGGQFSTTADVYRDAAVVVVEGGGRGQSGVASAYATTTGSRHITVDFSGNVAVTASNSLVEVFGQGLFGVTATQVLTATSGFLTATSGVLTATSGVLTSTSQPVQANVTQIATTAVTSTAAQIGVNLVNIAGTVVTPTAAQIGVNVVSLGTGVINATNYATGYRPSTATQTVPANIVQVATANVAATVAQIGVNLVNIAGAAVNTGSAQLGVNLVSVATGVINATNYATGYRPITASQSLSATGYPTNFATLAIDASGRVILLSTATGAITASSFGAGAINGTVIATDAASKINQYTAAIRGGAAFNGFRFSMLATSGTSYATDQSPSVSLGFGTVAAATVAGTVTAVGNDYVVNFTATEVPASQMGIMRATATGALTREISIITTPAT